jgi:multidrug efflux pump subunit AcrA (membrane-fusion protein)
MRALEEATMEAQKFASRSEALAALLLVGRGKLEQARAERAKAAAEAEAAAAAEAAAVEAAAALARLQLEERRAALDARQAVLQENQAALALEMQQVDAQLGVAAPAAPAPQPEPVDALCVVCMDAPKQCVVVPCMHMSTCEACTQQLLQQGAESCPVCRGPIESTTRVFW